MTLFSDTAIVVKKIRKLIVTGDGGASHEPG